MKNPVFSCSNPVTSSVLSSTGKHRNWKVRNRTGNLLYGDLTEKIIGLCYEIHKQYGSGQKESVYQNALDEKLGINNIPFEKEVGISIKSEDTGKNLGNHRLDFVVDRKVVVETKAIKFTPIKLEQQLFSYLKNSKYPVGLMINFGSSKLYIKRIILTL
jgi:GxxExxY protein